MRIAPVHSMLLVDTLSILVWISMLSIISRRNLIFALFLRTLFRFPLFRHTFRVCVSSALLEARTNSNDLSLIVVCPRSTGSCQAHYPVLKSRSASYSRLGTSGLFFSNCIPSIVTSLFFVWTIALLVWAAIPPVRMLFRLDSTYASLSFCRFWWQINRQYIVQIGISDLSASCLFQFALLILWSFWKQYLPFIPCNIGTKWDHYMETVTNRGHNLSSSSPILVDGSLK